MRRAHVLKQAGFATTVAVLLTGCGGGGSSSGAAPAAVPQDCPAYIAGRSLVYPEPGTVKVATSVGVIVVSGDVAEVTLQPTVGEPIVSVTTVPVPSPLPTPDGPALNPPDTAFSIPVLASGQTYSVIAQNGTATPSPATCANDLPEQLGSFST